MTQTFAGVVEVKNGGRTIRLDGNEGDIVVLKKIRGRMVELLKFDGSSDTLLVQSASGRQAFRLECSPPTLYLGSNDAPGELMLANCGKVVVRDHLGHELLKFGGTARSLSMSDKGGRNGVHLQSDHGAMYLSGDDGYQGIKLDPSLGTVSLGGNGHSGRIYLYNQAVSDPIPESYTILISGADGDIRLRNGDCAEEFDIIEEEEAEPGSVMVIEQDGRLRQRTESYDRRVAGVISGAAEYRPGIILGREQSRHQRVPLALLGKVFCKADAQYAAIGVGDLLTTSGTRGHAMKAADPTRSHGSVMGKALQPLPDGRGLIPILVTLQ